MNKMMTTPNVIQEYVKELQRCFINIQNDKFIYNVVGNVEESIKNTVSEDFEAEEAIECPIHGIPRIPRKVQILTDEFDSCHAIQTLPKYVCLRKFNNSENCYGVWSNIEIPSGIKFGPYEGNIVYGDVAESQSDYCWQTMKYNGIDCFVDGQDQCQSNWLRYINFASYIEEQNLVAWKCGGQIYFQTLCCIPPGTELLVWYGNDYATEIGIINCGNGQIVSKKKEHKMKINYKALWKNDFSKLRAQEGCNKTNTNVEITTATVNVNKNQQMSSKERICVCNKRFKNISESSIHVDRNRSSYNACKESSSPKKNLSLNTICELCDKKFKNYSNLKKHLFLHTGERPFKCDLCEKRFARKHQLTIHRRVHTGEKPFVCNECGKGFVGKAQLKLHQYIHTGDKRFICDICGRRFTKNYELKIHQFNHSGERPYSCDVCGKTFPLKYHLQVHAPSHSNERTYICDLCGKGFLRLSCLKSHKLTHTAIKPYLCNVCGKDFVKSCRLKSHQRIHTGEKPFPCDVCGKEFSEKSSMKRHLHAVHRKEQPHENEHTL